MWIGEGRYSVPDKWIFMFSQAQYQGCSGAGSEEMAQEAEMEKSLPLRNPSPGGSVG